MILLSLFVACFLAATLLPGGSEAALIAAQLEGSSSLFSLWLVATVGNTAGGALTAGMGRAAARLKSPQALASSPREKKALAWLEHWGAWALLLSPVPLMGDLLCLAAGWLRLPWPGMGLALLVGKGLRYLLVLWLAGLLS